MPPKFGSLEAGISTGESLNAELSGGGLFLDIGAGTGRDMRLLLDRGYDARGVDVSSEMVRFALNSDPRLCGRLEEGGIPTDSTYIGARP